VAKKQQWRLTKYLMGNFLLDNLNGFRKCWRAVAERGPNPSPVFLSQASSVLKERFTV